MRKTKIICTIGPASEGPEILEKLIENGMNIARLNLSHGSREEHGEQIDRIIRIREKLGGPVALLMDTRGPEIRTGKMRDGKVELKAGQEILLTIEDCVGDSGRIPVNYPGIVNDIGTCETVLIDDGNIQLKVLEIKENGIKCRAENSGTVKSEKGVNVPGARLDLPILSEKDRSDIIFGIQKGIDYVAVSFARSGNDIVEVRNFLDKNGGANVRIIAKIENEEGVGNAGEIMEMSDGVMVARGDLGVEVSFEQVPFIQKNIIRSSLSHAKPVVVATQMLESMISNPRPTRAEVSDVYNAVNEEASAVMLSGETAMGKYPLECLSVMSETCAFSESKIDYNKRFFAFRESQIGTITGAVTNAAVNTAINLDAKAIVVLTFSGRTAFSISRLRPSTPLIAITPHKKVYHQLALNWGVIPILTEMKDDFESLIQTAMDIARKSGLVQKNDKAVIVAGMPVGKTGYTNSVRVEIA